MRLNRARQESIRDAVVLMARRAEPTAFAVEGTCRHAIRSALVLQSWRWPLADFVAHEIIVAALNMVGAKRPTWEQGQPEWTQPGILTAPRFWCMQCGRPLPDGHYRFCSRVCAAAHQHDVRYARDREERLVAAAAYRAAYREQAPEQPCERCGVSFRPSKKTQRYCSPQCAHSTRGIYQCI
jgi:hypothetical protein